MYIRNKLCSVTGTILKLWSLQQGKATFWSKQGYFGIFFPTLCLFRLNYWFFPPLFCLLWFWCFFSFQLKEQSSGFQEVPKCTDWCLREGHDSWIQDRPDPGCHFKQSDRGEKPCLMASLPQKSDASHLGRPQKEPWRWAE